MFLFRAFNHTFLQVPIMRSRFQHSPAVLLLITLTPILGCASAPTGRSVDLLITGGTVYRGDMDEPTVTDIGIVADKIVFIGNASRAHMGSKKILNAKGLMVTPGLIDAHVHDDSELSSPEASERLVTRQVTQGVTTSIIGVDGDGTSDIKAEFDNLQRDGPAFLDSFRGRDKWNSIG
jgi:N-acyl-D-amino-acid deacylase